MDLEDFAAGHPPTAVYCAHANYRSRILELGRAVPAEPSYFLKPLASLSGGGPVALASGARYLCFEGEMAVLVGSNLRDVDEETARRAVVGMAAANDMGLHDLVHVDAGSLLRDKGQDGFCPIGPWVEPLDPTAVLSTRVDGRVVQSAPLAEMLFDPGYLLADLARFTTLRAGDVVLTGTPAGSRPLAVGQTVTVDLGGRSTVSSTVVGSPRPAFSGGAWGADTAQARLLALAEVPPAD